MRISDKDYEEFLGFFKPEDIPQNPVEARQAIENFVDLVALLARPLPSSQEGDEQNPEPPMQT